jgi:acyl carrier protein
VNERFIALLRQNLRFLAPAEVLRPDIVLTDLGLDSLGAVALMLDLEDELGITFPDSSLAAGTFHTVGSLWSVVADLLDPRHESAF